jgi:Leucine-rich repeat (LRR) protein
MNHKYISLILVLLPFLWFGCDPKTTKEDILTVSVASISASANSNTYEVKVTTSVKEFEVSSNSVWCTTVSNVANSSFSVSLTANNLDLIRSAIITVTAGTKTVTISVTQEAGEVIVIVITPTMRDSIALIALNTGATKWNTAEPMDKWTGVKLEVISGYRRVTELSVPDNTIITGAISDSIRNLTELVYLDFSGNNLTGSVPDLSGLVKLVVLELKNNKLTGGIPLLPVSLAYLSLGQNTLSGNLPVQINSLTALMVFDLGLNDFTGTIPAEWVNLTKVKYFYLYGNQLSGEIPTYISTFSKMEALALDFNQLSGSIPSGIGLINSLQKLTLQQNKLSGNVPADILNNANWPDWSATVVPQQNGEMLGTGKKATSELKKNICISESRDAMKAYPLPDKRSEKWR